MKMKLGLSGVMILFVIHQSVGPPVTTKKQPPSQEKDNNATNQLEQMGIEYNRYLTQVVEVLESDPEFRKKLENAHEADIRSGKIAEELDYVNHHVRTKLDELKRQELERLRHLARQAYEQENNIDSKHMKIPEHVDHTNPNSFEIADLQKLIAKVTADLAEADKLRREEFHEYEMQKEFEKREKLKGLTEEEQKEYLNQLEAQKQKHQKHDPIHHPGSKQQLEEVWEKQDHMENQDFDPKAFFYMHDLDGNGVWDQEEVKALFLKELDKMYQQGVPEDDMRERAEEMERMREHVFSESDLNKDGLISYEEFLAQTRKPEFQKDQGWETIDQQPQYTPEEYAEFERRRQQEIERLIQEGKLQRMPAPPYGMPPHPQAQFQPPPHPAYQNQIPPQQQYHAPPQPQYQVPPQQYHQAGQFQQQQYQGQPPVYQGNVQPQVPPVQQYGQPQPPLSNNIPQQQPLSNNIPQQQQQQVPPQQQRPPVPQQQQQVPQQQQQVPQQQQQVPQQQVPQQQVPQQQVPQRQQQQQQVPQQQQPVPQQPVQNNIPQQPISNNIPQQATGNMQAQPSLNKIDQQHPAANQIPQQPEAKRV